MLQDLYKKKGKTKNSLFTICKMVKGCVTASAWKLKDEKALPTAFFFFVRFVAEKPSWTFTSEVTFSLHCNVWHSLAVYHADSRPFLNALQCYQESAMTGSTGPTESLVLCSGSRLAVFTSMDSLISALLIYCAPWQDTFWGHQFAQPCEIARPLQKNVNRSYLAQIMSRSRSCSNQRKERYPGWSWKLEMRS